MTSSTLSRRTLLVCLFLNASLAFAENRFVIEDSDLPFSSTGNVVSINMDADQDVYSISIFMRFDPSKVQVGSVDFGADLAPIAPEWFDGIIDNSAGELSYGVVFDLSGPDITKNIAAGTDLEVLRVLIDVIAAESVSTTLDLLNTNDTAPVRANVMTDVNGLSQRPTLVDGVVTLVDKSPLIQSFVDNQGREGDTFFIVGDFFDQSGLLVRICGQEVPATLLGDNRTLQVTAPACTVGAAEVEVCTELGCDSDPSGFNYLPDPPVIDSITGNEGEPGTEFVIVGQNFGFAGLNVEVCGKPAVSVLDVDGVTLRVTAPDCDLGPAVVEVCTDFGCASDSAGFNYIDIPDPPVIENLVDNEGQPGDHFMVTGQNFSEPGLVVRVCGVDTEATLLGDGITLEVTAPGCGFGPAELEICNEDGCDNDPLGFTYVEPPPPPPIIESLADTSGRAGDTFTITGQHLGEPGLVVEVCGVESIAEFQDATTLLVTVPSSPCAPGPADVSVCTDYGCDTRTGGYTYLPDPPVIESLESNSGREGDSFSILGQNFGESGLRVEVCGVEADATLQPDGTTIIVVAPACGSDGPAPVTVCTDFGCDTVDEGFTYVPGVPFRRGLVNGDDRMDLSDGIFILGYLFAGGSTPGCLKAADLNDTSEVDLTDAVFIFNYLFLKGPPPREPRLECGTDPTVDNLSCETPSAGC